ncbi:Isochorismatase-like [Moorella glycerini]|uniref:N-carbamoylsarcosine amidase n=1 Tax=Neomoorella stamsii TaxID=1266720 RepID=A0A9X7J269_9FIRM|nr:MULTISPECIES: isochorismatase family protein [Moorella]PRR70654.1 N-carbamoylsarcosine amidase [Moorella stamsii]CEP67997.1 Isochorismatase-like [Moorella glycerini]
MPVWDDVVTPWDLEAIANSGWGKRRGYGQKPAVLVIDAQYKFIGSKKEINTPLNLYRKSIGLDTWQAVKKIKELLVAARAKQVPVFYFTVLIRESEKQFYWSPKKKHSIPTKEWLSDEEPDQIVQELAPQKGDIIIPKQFPSAFFGTPLINYLISLGVDTLLVTGFVTSGCVRSTVVDACTFGYNTIVVEECVADPIPISHKVSLLDMNLKYADVEKLDKVLQYIKSL